MSRYRSGLAGVLLALASLALTFGLLELILRLGFLTPERFRSTAIEAEPGSRPGRPDFRLPTADLENKGDAFRIVVVGDSFAWGAGVYARDAFPHRLESRLDEVSQGDRFEVINWSRPGWNTARQVRSLRKGKPLGRLQPDLVILSFVLNDPEPVEDKERQALLPRWARERPEDGTSAWLFDHSRLYALVWSRLENTRTRREVSTYYHDLFEGEHWEACRKALAELERMSQSHGFALLVVVFPVFDGPLDKDYRYADLHAAVVDVGSTFGVPVLDLLPTYAGVEDRRLAVTPFTNAHPNELAHRLAADAILDELVRRRLIPRVDHRPKPRRRIGKDPSSPRKSRPGPESPG